jgi:hypothetical protein
MVVAFGYTAGTTIASGLASRVSGRDDWRPITGGTERRDITEQSEFRRHSHNLRLEEVE